MPIDRFSTGYYGETPCMKDTSPSVTSVNSKIAKGPIGAAGMIPMGIRRRYSVVVRVRSMGGVFLQRAAVELQRGDQSYLTRQVRLVAP
jgi:hypothetical protein